MNNHLLCIGQNDCLDRRPLKEIRSNVNAVRQTNFTYKVERNVTCRSPAGSD